MTTHLPKRSVCASACVLLFAGGIIRTYNSSKIGVHVGSGVLNESALELFDEIYSKHGKEGFALIAHLQSKTLPVSLLSKPFRIRGVAETVRKTIDVHHLEVHG